MILARLGALIWRYFTIDVELWFLRTRARLIGGRLAQRMLREGRKSWNRSSV